MSGGLVEFLHNEDLADSGVFVARMCEAAGGGVSWRAPAMLMRVCKRARHSPVVLLLLQFVARQARADRDLPRLVAGARLLMAVRDNSPAAARAYQLALQALPATIPPLCAYSSQCAGHAMLRAHAFRSGAFGGLFALLAEHVARPLERAHVRANMQAAVVCMHKCVVHVGDRLCLVSERERFEPAVLAAIAHGLVAKYALLTHDINVEYISVGVLECICGARFDGAVFEHLVVRFCDCVSDGHELMALFVHHSLLRLLARADLRAALAAHVLHHRSLDYILTRVYSNPDVSPDAYAAVAAVAAELVNCASEVDDDTFGRVEQLVMVTAGPPHSLGVRECFAHLLARAVLFYAGAMPVVTANRVMQSMCEMSAREFAPDSPAQTHLCAAVHHLALVRRCGVMPATWEHILRLAGPLCARSPHELTPRGLALFLHALREVPVDVLFAALQRAQLLSAVLRDREYVADEPGSAVLLLKIMHVLAQRLSPEILAAAHSAAHTAALAQRPPSELLASAQGVVLDSLDLGESLRQLCRACVEVPRVYRSAGGRSLILFLGRLLHGFAQTGALPRGELRVLALGLMAHSLRHAGRGNQHILRTHRVARLWLAQQHAPSPAASALFADFVEAAASNGAEHRAVRVSTLCLLRQVLSRNAECCACAHAQPAACQAMLLYCVRAFAARGAYDLSTYLTAQRVLHVLVSSPAHAASKLGLPAGAYDQLVNGINTWRSNLHTELHSRHDAATLDKLIISRLEVADVQ